MLSYHTRGSRGRTLLEEIKSISDGSVSGCKGRDEGSEGELRRRKKKERGETTGDEITLFSKIPTTTPSFYTAISLVVQMFHSDS